MRGEYIQALEMRARWLRWVQQKGYDLWSRLDSSRNWQEHYGTQQSWTAVLPIYEYCLKSGELFFMNKNFCRLVDEARKTIPDDMKFDSTWMHAKQGWMWIEEPFVVPRDVDQASWDKASEKVYPIVPSDLLQDVPTRPVSELLTEGRDAIKAEHVRLKHELDRHEKARDKIDTELLALTKLRERIEVGIKVAAIGWTEVDYKAPLTGKGIEFLCYQDFHLYDEKSEGFGCWSYFGLRDGDMLIDRIREFEAKAHDEGGFYTSGSKEVDMMHEIRWVYAAMYLMSQRLAVNVHHNVDRHTRRRHERENVPLPPFLQVVSLRRMEEERPKTVDAKGDPVDWNWQWSVVGHWRNQWYAHEGVHKPKWIESYIKGPEDKPLKPISVKLFAAVR